VATYATTDELAAYLEASGVSNPCSDEDTEKLLERSERSYESPAPSPSRTLLRDDRNLGRSSAVPSLAA